MRHGIAKFFYHQKAGKNDKNLAARPGNKGQRIIKPIPLAQDNLSGLKGFFGKMGKQHKRCPCQYHCGQTSDEIGDLIAFLAGRKAGCPGKGLPGYVRQGRKIGNKYQPQYQQLCDCRHANNAPHYSRRSFFIQPLQGQGLVTGLIIMKADRGNNRGDI